MLLRESRGRHRLNLAVEPAVDRHAAALRLSVGHPEVAGQIVRHHEVPY